MAKVKQIGDKYWYQKDADTASYEISATKFANIQTAQDTGWGQAALATAGERMASAVNKLPGVDNFMGVEDNLDAMTALKSEHPVASTVGTMLPYAATAPVLGTTTIPRAMAGGAAEAGAFALPGEGVQDTLMGAVFGVGGHMVGRVIENMLPHFTKEGVEGILPRLKGAWEEPAQTTKQILNSEKKFFSGKPGAGQQGFWDKKLANTIGGSGPANIFARENQKRLNQVAADALGFDPSTITKMTPDMAEGASARAQSMLAGKTQARMKEIIDAQMAKVVQDSADSFGNVSPGKLMKGYADMIDDLSMKTLNPNDQVYMTLVREQFEMKAEKLMQRATDLTDPKQGLFMPTNKGSSEELIADVARGLLPATGWSSYANFLPSMVPVGKGGNIGTQAGAMSGGLLDQMQAYLEQ